MLILIFIAAGALRLNECDLFNPDSPRYLIYGQGLAETGEYRAIDLPGEPIYTWRPPGLPLLLAPVLAFRPYDVVAAKCVVLATAALLLLAVHALATRTGGGWGGPAMVAVVASSPVFLVLSTEVLTEVPYALGTLSVLYWLGSCVGRSSRCDSAGAPTNISQVGAGAPTYDGIAALAVLAFLPFVRTVAVALVAAVGLWSLASRRRWPHLIAVAAAIAGIVWQAQRSGAASGESYAGSVLNTIHERGVLGVVVDAANTLAYYTSTVPDVLLPGVTSGRPFFAPLLIQSPTSLSMPEALAFFVAGLVVLLGVAGMWSQRDRAGGVALLYLPLYAACLAIWPWRHERFAWVLVPLVWAFVPAGVTAIVHTLPIAGRVAAKALGGLGLLALCGWQCVADSQLVSTNLRYLTDGDSFFSDAAPSFYYSDFRRAGAWIRVHTPPDARVLTWHAAVGATAHRYQQRVAFETKTPAQIRRQVEAFSARYVVVPTAQFDDGFGWQIVDGDQACTFTVVYRERGVTILSVEPNRTGKVSRSRYEAWLNSRLAELNAYLQQHPHRSDLIARRATLLSELGRTDDAIDDLRSLVDRGVVSVRICASLGWLLLEEKRHEEAARYLDLARGLPNAESIAAALADGARFARERQQNGADETTDSAIAHELRRLQGFVAALKWAAAERSAERLVALAPDHAEARYWRGYVHQVLGEPDRANEYYERALELGSEDARDKLLLLRLSEAVERDERVTIRIGEQTESVDPTSVPAHVRLARLFDEHGWPGRAVATLEAACERFGDDPAILVPLADLHRRFAQVELDAPRSFGNASRLRR